MWISEADIVWHQHFQGQQPRVVIGGSATWYTMSTKETTTAPKMPHSTELELLQDAPNAPIKEQVKGHCERRLRKPFALSNAMGDLAVWNCITLAFGMIDMTFLRFKGLFRIHSGQIQAFQSTKKEGEEKCHPPNLSVRPLRKPHVLIVLDKHANYIYSHHCKPAVFLQSYFTRVLSSQWHRSAVASEWSAKTKAKGHVWIPQRGNVAEVDHRWPHLDFAGCHLLQFRTGELYCYHLLPAWVAFNTINAVFLLYKLQLDSRHQQ